MQGDPIEERLPESIAREHLKEFGIRLGDKGTHTSRTIMLGDLERLLEECPPQALREEYAAAIIEHNCLGKRTASTRKISFQRLRELYGLDPSIPLFRLLRQLWQTDQRGRPLLALLTALARDSLLRVTAEVIGRMRSGEELARQQLTDAIANSAGDRLSSSTIDKVVRNTAASWTQSGHLRGRGRKVRQSVQPTPVVVSFALLLAHVTGMRGMGLFHSFWAETLDSPPEGLLQMAIDARRLGLLDLMQSGGVVEVSFARLLTTQERQLINGTH
ncbi:MAG: hypothetical protein KAY24_14960 [Candidatus Eisenbacteria sp.]|nr:hypothetical protein [Candidatus Eisenbacteria bacterium]